MSLAAELAPHLPFLRRFARSLTGSQASGDAYVTAVLETLIADVDMFPKDVDVKVGLYKTFATIWKSIDVNVESYSSIGSAETSDHNLQLIAPLPRQAFLLVAVEGFSKAEGAEILSMDEAEFSELLVQASRDIAQQVATDVMIIEDEPLIAMDIETLVTDLGHNVTGIARTRTEANTLFRKKKPGIILSDIQLADGSSGIDAVNDILKEASVPVIFITAYPEQLLTGNRPEPAFLVTKPFQADMVRALISQALFFDRQSDRKSAA
jgi:CheY-like chemotaxis protein